MNTLANLKNRLEALPLIREARKHEAQYAEYGQKCALANDRLAKAAVAAAYAPAVLPASGYGAALKTTRSAQKIASRLREKLEAEPGAVVEKNTEASFLRLFENAADALKSCQTVWEQQLQAKIKNWQTIAEVVAKLGEQEEAKSLKSKSTQLKKAIDSLAVAQTRLPGSEPEIAQVRADLKALQDAVAQLGLDTPFGKFLQDAASAAGADLSSAQSEEVAKQIAELKLAKVFRVRLSS